MSAASISQLREVSVQETLTSERGTVDLWYYFCEGIEAEVLDAHEALLTPNESDQHRSFYFERDRRLFLASRALVRTVLSSYTTALPTDWRFATNEHGKPFISAPVVVPKIHFNLAHTPGLVVCAVSAAHESIGVDVERIDREVEAVEIAERYFSKREADNIRDLPACDRLRRFLAYWTLKESYVKARGLGLVLHPDQSSFFVEDEIGVEFDERLADNAASWRFGLLDAPPQHMIAVGAKTGGAPLSLRARRFVPTPPKHCN
jgi:4'-phosphopantetheinyl transferase